MEPRIQYAKTSDGVNIAYVVLGTGPAIVFPSGNWGAVHMYKSGASAIARYFDELVSLGWSVIAYDSRGAGSSDHDVEDQTLEARLRDIDAVVEKAAPGRFAVLGHFAGGPTAIAYTAAHPERVSHLILANTYASGSEGYELVPALRLSQQTLRDAEKGWEFATLTLASALHGYADSDRARRMAEAFRTSTTAKNYISWRNATVTIDVSDLLAQITVPTLVLHDRASPVERLGVITRRLAPLIPNARFVETNDLAKVVDEFLREGGLVPTPQKHVAAPAAPLVPSLPSGMNAILFADIADSTALTERLGDAAFRAKARELAASLRGLIRECAGTPVEGPTLGDGVLAVFTSAREAIEAARRCGRAGDNAGLPLHLGLHADDITREKDPDGRNNVYGGAVNIASRISGLSAAGEVLVSDTVRSLARTSAGVRFEDRGEQALKGVREPVRVWAVVEAET